MFANIPQVAAVTTDIESINVAAVGTANDILMRGHEDPRSRRPCVRPQTQSCPVAHEAYLLSGNDRGFDSNWRGFGTQIARAKINDFLQRILTWGISSISQPKRPKGLEHVIDGRLI